MSQAEVNYNKIRSLLILDWSQGSGKIAYAITLIVGSGNVNVHTPVAKQQQPHMYWWSGSDDWSWNVLFCFVISFSLRWQNFTRERRRRWRQSSTEQSRRETRNQLCREWGTAQSLTPQITTALTKHSTQRIMHIIIKIIQLCLLWYIWRNNSCFFPGRGGPDPHIPPWASPTTLER